MASELPALPSGMIRCPVVALILFAAKMHSIGVAVAHEGYQGQVTDGAEFRHRYLALARKKYSPGGLGDGW